MDELVEDNLVTRLSHPDVTARPVPVDVLFDGLSGLRWNPGGDVHVNGQQVSSTTRRVSDLLTAGGDQPLPMVDRAAAEAMVNGGHDSLLYRAVRDVFPPRPTTRSTARADLVIYEDIPLPGDEPCRSLGHWNAARQMEVFQVLTGEVAMLVAGETVNGDPFGYVDVCGCGDVVAMPLDVWHASYVLRGPAIVFNVYAGLDGPLTARQGERAGDKYRRAAPAGITLRRLADELRALSTAEAHRYWGEFMDPPGAEWLVGPIREHGSLPAFHHRASVADWDVLATAFAEAYNLGWPLSAG